MAGMVEAKGLAIDFLVFLFLLTVAVSTNLNLCNMYDAMFLHQIIVVVSVI